MTTPKKKRFITVTDDNHEVIYKGEDNRYYNEDYSNLKCKLGIPILDWIKGTGFIIAIATQFLLLQHDVGFIKNDVHIFREYIINHDAWDSAFFGTRFNNGQPVDGNFSVKK